ncbi:MAG: extracellular solute-binding protein, partial [Halomonas subglaciescola]|nr:extracellular solute-binding protein [Halomonas subglaciescola]
MSTILYQRLASSVYTLGRYERTYTMRNAMSCMLKTGPAALAALMLAGPAAVQAQDETLTVYNGQHKDVTTALIDAFEKKTGIEVEARNGSSNELAHQIVEEGERSPADIIYTEESTPLIMLSEKGLLTSINDQALNNIPEEYQGENGEWVGLLARSRVVVYNQDAIDEESLPDSVKDFADPEWDGRFAFVKTSGAFQKQLSAMIKLDGRDAAKAWLEGL